MKIYYWLASAIYLILAAPAGPIHSFLSYDNDIRCAACVRVNMVADSIAQAQKTESDAS